MAYQSKNLSVIAYANGFTFWHYATEDTAVSVATDGYFNDAADMLRVGDVILANVETSASPSTGFFSVASNVSGAVDVNDMTGIGTSNTN
ncbi:hypothetical protein [Curvivirga aplysinae]|uniref:hypothetical protein n=1 Tax=Curvivirga aplysinae TaxID=2529852 RepID=UPI0012BD1C92|nr:hypothetical protein [Curvivirga aplysinae]MTI08490.1 hypothetical protein [Curvivirga aplysinae]